MNVSKIIVTGLMAAALPALAEVKVGDTRQQVVAELGIPAGEIASGTYQLLTYERGKVELREGKVAKLELISAEQLEKNRALRAEQLAAAEKRATDARLKRIADGTTVRKAKLADNVFMLSPASDRVAYWQNFQKLYPEIPLGDEYTAALKELDQQLALQRVERAKQDKIDELEERVASAEARARQAEQQKSYVYTDYTYGPSYVALPYWSYQPHHHTCTTKPCPVCSPTSTTSTTWRNPYAPTQRSWVSSPFVRDYDCDPGYGPGVSVGYRSPGLSIQFNGR